MKVTASRYRLYIYIYIYINEFFIVIIAVRKVCENDTISQLTG